LNGHSVLERLEFGQAVGVALDEVGEAVKHAPAVGGTDAGPFPLQRAASRGHGEVHVRRAGGEDIGYLLAAAGFSTAIILEELASTQSPPMKSL
jgi:hypothetical protein